MVAPVDFYGKLLHLYPNITDEDVTVIFKFSKHFIIFWNGGKLGTMPSVSYVLSVSDADAKIARDVEQGDAKFTNDKVIRAVIDGVASKLPGVTAAELQAAVRAAYKALN